MTPTLSTRAQRAVIYANAASASHKASKHKRKQAQKLVALELIYELRKAGKSVSRKIENVLRK